jgi:hypothetical protein
MCGSDLKILGEVFLQAHPPVVMANFATPSANAQHAFKVMQSSD